MKLTYVDEFEVSMGGADEVVAFFFNDGAGDFQNR